MSTVRPAATVVLLRDGEQGLETLLLRRHHALEFAAGMWVFPGGAVDSDDYAGDPHDLFAAARRAAAREAQEEAGLIVDADNLTYFAHWTTPEPSKKRYATWFFAAPFHGDHLVTVDGGEIDLHQWVRPQDAIAAYRRREVELMPPTFIALQDLLPAQDCAAALGLLGAREVMEILPRVVRGERGPLMLYPGDAGYSSGDPTLAGARHRCEKGDAGWDYLCSL